MRVSLAIVGVATVIGSGCERKKTEDKKYDGPMPIMFGDCASASVAFVSGPRPAPFTLTEAEHVWLDDATTQTASAETDTATDGEVTETAPALDPGRVRGEPRPAGNYHMREDPEAARKAALEAARSAGMLGIVEGGGFASLTGPGGFESVLSDDDVYGGFIGDAFGDVGGGLGSKRGGGTGWGTIGTSRYGTIGRGAGTGTGYGYGAPGMRRPSSDVPDVRIGPATVQGDLDKNIIRRFIKRSINKIRYCYEKQLLVNPNAQGTVTVTFFIAANGEVATAKAEAGDTDVGLKPQVTTCIAQMVKTLVFPKPKDGGGVQVSYPFTFRKAEPAPKAKPTTTALDTTPPRVDPSPPDPDPLPPPGPSDTAIGGNPPATSSAGRATPSSPTAHRRLYREPGSYDRTYKPGAGNPLAGEAKALEDCFRTGEQHAGVAVVETTYDAAGKVAAATVHGIDDKRVQACVGKVAARTRGAAGASPQRCSLAYGELPMSRLPGVEITADGLAMDGTQLVPMAAASAEQLTSTLTELVTAIEARVSKATEQTAPVVAIHGPLVVRPIDATPMRVVKRALASVITAQEDFVLAHQAGTDWQLLEPLALPVVPVPFGTGGMWNRVKAGRSRGSDQRPAQMPAIVVDANLVWIGINGGRGQELAAPGGAVPRDQLAAALAALSKQPGGTQIEIAARDAATYASFVAVVLAARDAGFTDWQVTDSYLIVRP